MCDGKCELNDQPIYMIDNMGRCDAAIYVVDGVAFAAKPQAIYEALQVDAEVGPHRFAAATNIGEWIDGLDRLDARLLPRPTTVRGEAIDAVAAVSEWMDWCDEVIAVAAKEAGAVWEHRIPERRADAAKWAARDTWAVTDAAHLDTVHTTLAHEEINELVATLDLRGLRRAKAMLSTLASATMVGS